MPSLPTAGSQVTAPLTQNTRFQVVCSNPVLRAAIAQVVIEVAPQRFVAFELPMNSASDLNDLGDVVGTRYRDGYPYEAVVWMAGAVEVLGYSVPPYEMDSYHPGAMNSSRTVIGYGSPGLSVMTDFPFRWNVGVGLVPTIISMVPGQKTAYSDINDAAQIVGTVSGRGAMLFSGGTMFPLFGSTDPGSSAKAINGLGHITGSFVPGADGIHHVFLYIDGAIQDLGTLDGLSSAAQDINMSDEIVGSTPYTPAPSRAFLYANSRFTDLGSLGGASSWATGVNDAGKIVGSSTLAGPDPQERRAFLYVNGRMFDVNELVDALPWPLTYAPKINNRGQIIANGCPPQRAPPQYGQPSDCRAYLLTPVPLQ
jgi:probable HAF family extracellular repeat protein